jgi:hypothetical protein
MNGFLIENGFEPKILNKDFLIYSFCKDKRKIITFCLHKRIDTSFMDANAEIWEGNKLLSAVDFIRFFNEENYTFKIPIDIWYFNNDEELNRIVNKQKIIIKKFITPIFSEEMKFDFKFHMEEEKRKVFEILNTKYNGNWYEYTKDYLIKKQEEWTKFYFKEIQNQ